MNSLFLEFVVVMGRTGAVFKKTGVFWKRYLHSLSSFLVLGVVLGWSWSGEERVHVSCCGKLLLVLELFRYLLLCRFGRLRQTLLYLFCLVGVFLQC